MDVTREVAAVSDDGDRGLARGRGGLRRGMVSLASVLERRH